MFDTLDGLPIHSLVIHASIVLIAFSVVGGVALALHAHLRHQYGYMMIGLIYLPALVTTWVAVESGKVLTEYPGLGSTEHADAGTVLFNLLIPFTILNIALVLLDRLWAVGFDEESGMHYRHGNETQAQNDRVTFIGGLAIGFALMIIYQLFIVGHTGAEGTWGDVL